MTAAVYKHLSIEKAMEFIGDEDSVRTLLETLQQSLADDTPEIQRQLDLGDLAGANRLLHQFKGFAPVFCVPSLVERIVQIEALSKQPGQLAAVREAYATLGPQLQALLQEVLGQLEPRA